MKAIIDQWLAEDEKQPPKQRHTARRTYERLVAEYDFQGAESTVRRYVGQRRRGLRTQAFIPLSYAPGQRANVRSWGAVARSKTPSLPSAPTTYRFCRPAQGHEKGLVEGLVGYARRHWFVPVPHFPSWDGTP